MDVLEVSKGALRLNGLALAMRFAQGAVRMHGDSRLVQMDHAKFAKTLKHEGGDYRLKCDTSKPWKARQRAIVLSP